ncbi:hypothetical protein BDV24DRAFT_128307 [Aspergillus arachidicola]|uniref:Uncharacterized protein n=1 Tax=Aspergillus arachidicola TaxID=656916 RepID=A0A5N6YF48_9EURO|nr:hypothetical protein BDV24DRAFT_128307 [Aspergillus arachidicola]
MTSVPRTGTPGHQSPRTSSAQGPCVQGSDIPTIDGPEGHTRILVSESCSVVCLRI